jgi:4-aminobutyrate aminotransferase-like enzyme
MMGILRLPIPFSAAYRRGRAEELSLAFSHGTSKMSRPPPFGRRLPSVSTPPPGPVSRSLAERLARVEARTVTYLGPDLPVFWSEARGGNVRDVDGNEYVDLNGAFGVAAAGHAHPRIAAAIREQAERLIHGMGDIHPPERKLALLERLAELAPWGADRTRVLLANSGSEAVEIALKTALLATGRPGILAFRGAYHGLTAGALATTHRAHFRGPFLPRLYPGVRFLPFPDDLEDGPAGAGAALEALDRELDRAEAEDRPVGAVLLEPIQGRGGIRVPPAGFLPEVALRARERGALLLADEIYTAFGRCGQLLALEAEGLTPDLLCLGKALGGGLPMSACLGPLEVMDAWPPSTGEAVHTSTFLGHPLSCSAALAFLDVVEEEGLVERGRRDGEWLARGLEEALRGTPGVLGVRGRGMFLGIVLGGEGWPRGVTAREVMVAALRRGFLVLPAGSRGEVVELSPPLTLERAQLEAAVEGVAAAVREAAGAG